MRKIEIGMVKAIRDNLNFASGNTRVTRIEGGGMKVTLHGNPIARINEDGYIRINDCGYRTVTTKSRLNAILDSTCYRICQRDFEWYIINDDGTLFEFSGVATFSPAGVYCGNY